MPAVQCCLYFLSMQQNQLRKHQSQLNHFVKVPIHLCLSYSLVLEIEKLSEEGALGFIPEEADEEEDEEEVCPYSLDADSQSW